jgi:hypothetical protein
MLWFHEWAHSESQRACLVTKEGNYQPLATHLAGQVLQLTEDTYIAKHPDIHREPRALSASLVSPPTSHPPLHDRQAPLRRPVP